ncbi:M14 family zinc carboxypeptidase [Alteromonas flava]|uniref:M14 family zinc carboxypeptidase n=1 Tax=Alteromonas flava TaxID=2048003 RepID=UPI000C28240C|nr:M14 family zinc carboxypeptidase [Alteromonas flava]
MRNIACAALVLLSSCVSANTLTYTNTETGSNLIPLGYDVPIPIDSLTPIDGFRTYQSLNLRHQQLAAASQSIAPIQVGQTIEGLPIWAYQLSDSDTEKHSGGLEGSALINGGIHAREWQSPEVTTAIIEYLAAHETDQHLAQYLLENLNLLVIPVLNIDGYLQTQRHPNQVTNTQASPRDGRMRRKNMRSVDTSLDTEFDNLNGIDLNRNNAPYWATNPQRSSNDPNSIVYHGLGPASEPETQALQQAAVEAGEARLRFYTDVHSFTQVYFAPYTSNIRRNEILDRLATVMRQANRDPQTQRVKYGYAPSSSGSGIGATDEYFALTYDIPAYTLELEPQNSGADYGGFGVSHDGFILPASEVARMREEKTRATTAGLYAMTDVPYTQRVQVWDANADTLLIDLEWQQNGNQRQLVTLQANELAAQTDYQLKVVFNKPMRWLNDGGVAGFGSLSDPLDITLRWLGNRSVGEAAWDIDTASGQWLSEQGFARYKTDTFSVGFTLDSDFVWSELTRLALEIETTDFAGQRLDTDPATMVDFQSGAWQNYENTTGDATTDRGGSDKSMRIIDDGSDLFAPAPTPPAPTPNPTPKPSPSSDSGGSFGGILILLVGFLGQRWLRCEQH